MLRRALEVRVARDSAEDFAAATVSAAAAKRSGLRRESSMGGIA
jgi:hypothetical protein